MADNRNFEGELTKAIGHSLDWHKIVVMAIAIAIATIASHFFVWVGSKITGKYVALFGYLISGIGWLVGAVAVLCAMVAVCKMAAAKDAGDKKSFLAGIGYASASVLTVIFANLRYLVWLAAGILLTWILGYVGLIPKVGPVVWAIIGVIPVLVGLYVIFFIVAKFFLGTLILPGIIAQGGGKAIQYFKESKRIINGHTIRLIKRFLAIGLVIVVFVFATFEAWQFVGSKTEDTMADNAGVALSGGPPMRVPPIVPAYQNLPIIGNAANVGKALGGGKAAAAWIFGIWMIIILLALQSIPAIVFAVAGMYTYQGLKGEAEMPISSPDVKVDLSKMKGSLGAVGAKFREEMREGGEEKKAPPKKEG